MGAWFRMVASTLNAGSIHHFRMDTIEFYRTVEPLNTLRQARQIDIIVIP
jgi:hypothetical protein